ncbi:Uncharacterized conserved protein, DUF1697 family [Mesonia phycicola]|uniref:Uncharacterized conserved protein, DUF1697 family n=1 Tax=Mesonia phycicola TaxID=579105 RepID=A0A1M6AEJ4_9FLAO|nr:DUF1697 domain-containing protein [Mesonia phycicola]SHI34623.1 Uncharacterized conserved protein, DUF1697 family [Mesonia phycicola]
MSQKYVALLRGINVGGKRKLKMADLRESVLKIDFTEVSTYIQSGNLFFTSEEKNARILEEKLAQHLLDEYTYDIPVVIRTAGEIEKAISKNPFSNAEDFKQLHLIFLKENPAQDLVNAFKELEFPSEQFKIEEKHLYVNYTEGVRNSKLSTTFIEKKLKTKATARNWKTLLKIESFLKG